MSHNNKQNMLHSACTTVLFEIWHVYDNIDYCHDILMSITCRCMKKIILQQQAGGSCCHAHIHNCGNLACWYE